MDLDVRPVTAPLHPNPASAISIMDSADAPKVLPENIVTSVLLVIGTTQSMDVIIAIVTLDIRLGLCAMRLDSVNVCLESSERNVTVALRDGSFCHMRDVLNAIPVLML